MPSLLYESWKLLGELLSTEAHDPDAVDVVIAGLLACPEPVRRLIEATTKYLLERAKWKRDPLFVNGNGMTWMNKVAQ